MKRLGLLRHAKSSRDDPSIDDFDRPLNGRGRKAATRIGEELRSLGIEYDLALISPARRAADTFETIERAWKSGLNPDWVSKLYGAPPDQILGIVEAAPDSAERLLVVGHNPGMHELAVRLTADDGSGDRRLLSQKLPTGALVEIELPIDRWAEITDSGGRLLRFLRPRDLG